VRLPRFRPSLAPLIGLILAGVFLTGAVLTSSLTTSVRLVLLAAIAVVVTGAVARLYEDDDAGADPPPTP
jgi:hypothetical protein